MRYAVVDGWPNDPRLAYVVSSKNAAIDLADDADGESVVIPVRTGCPLKTRNGIPVDDDGQEETAKRLYMSIKPWLRLAYTMATNTMEAMQWQNRNVGT